MTESALKWRRLESNKGTADAEREILMHLFEATNGRYWKSRVNWGTYKPLEEWQGIDVNREGKVIGIDLSDNQLVGMKIL